MIEIRPRPLVLARAVAGGSAGLSLAMLVIVPLVHVIGPDDGLLGDTLPMAIAMGVAGIVGGMLLWFLVQLPTRWAVDAGGIHILRFGREVRRIPWGDVGAIRYGRNTVEILDPEGRRRAGLGLVSGRDAEAIRAARPA